MRKMQNKLEKLAELAETHQSENDFYRVISMMRTESKINRLSKRSGEIKRAMDKPHR